MKFGGSNCCGGACSETHGTPPQKALTEEEPVRTRGRSPTNRTGRVSADAAERANAEQQQWDLRRTRGGRLLEFRSRDDMIQVIPPTGGTISEEQWAARRQEAKERGIDI